MSPDVARSPHHPLCARPGLDHRLLAARETPFCHQDADAFWLHAPRADLLAAPAFAQHREPPQPEQAVLHARLTVRHGALAAMPALECNAGLLGGTDCAGLYCYAADSMAMALAPANRDALSAHRDGFPACSLLEQAAFSAAFGDRAEMLLTRREPPTWELDREGWRHYAADKSGPGHVAMIEQRLHRLHPATADRVWRLMHGTCIDPGAR